jgi:hypothetical protein
MRVALVLLAAVLITSGSANAQAAPQRSTVRLVAGGMAGSVGGAALGGLAAYALYSTSCSGPCEISGLAAVAGAGVGATLGAPLGVHVASSRRGDLAVSLLASAATLALGTASMYLVQSAIGNDGVVNSAYMVIGATLPALQIGISVKLHQRSRDKGVR